MKVLKTEKQKYIDDCKEILQDFIEIEPEEIHIVAVKDGQVYHKRSRVNDFIRSLGELEHMKIMLREK